MPRKLTGTVEQNIFLKPTVNQLNFAAVKFRGLPNSLYFAHFNFAFWYLRTKMFLHKNACSSLIYGPIFKISLVPETRFAKIAKFAKLNCTRNFVDLQ